MTEDKNYLGRMKDEHADIALKLRKLNAFIHGSEAFKELCRIEQSRMIKQAGFMESYEETLKSRIWVANYG